MDRGTVIDKTYQINVGGNTDFANMLERTRLQSKKISKTEAVQSQLSKRLNDKSIYVGPSDFIPFLGNRKLAFIRIDGRMFADIPFNMELRLDVDDKANSGGIAIDVIRCAQLALDRKVGGPLIEASAYLMKHPPLQMDDYEAKKRLDEWIKG
jgi:myo-inositol-1-phosphate synthase